eukprot:CAMPEP_0176456036 /NCGR_PEP_ID=MMETSP0127-20121128/31027_1 /TAXON_ID=938130 /ORGANISM="Platyophrya macrostoma, Strain WH" /LENGTH=54 /DNA_ID=CAMNT_0017845875 /DNA_START=35 /DNA_END=196 /DNA_ORIENTATION=+
MKVVGITVTDLTMAEARWAVMEPPTKVGWVQENGCRQPSIPCQAILESRFLSDL